MTGALFGLIYKTRKLVGRIGLSIRFVGQISDFFIRLLETLSLVSKAHDDLPFRGLERCRLAHIGTSYIVTLRALLVDR